ncbi:hypothetical protein BD410DRAFT_202880 [Rickenella mellea]|uniref:Fungal-type protein kinase domain-containing protein n=1 Tax=Rickenella mellea TaxID=50990 RepID=A0A4Y7Q622_9AGAM|nr:hypothetical protein BD410DRAFT_202880 [Rickenella mellea]
MLGDLDLCIPHIEEGCLTQLNGTSTLSFMAIELLANLDPPYHSPIHDMESVFWVLLWVVSHKNVNVAGDNPNPKDVKLCEDMSVANMTMDLVADVKTATMVNMQDMTPRRSGNLEPFRNLLVNGFNLVRHYKIRSQDLSADGETFSDADIETGFGEYLDVFEKNIPVETDWSHVKEGA